MARGGFRKNAGRRKLKPDGGEKADHTLASRVLDLPHNAKVTTPREKGWHDLLWHSDVRIQLETRKYLMDRELGRPVQQVRHGGTDGQNLPQPIVNIIFKD